MDIAATNSRRATTGGGRRAAEHDASHAHSYSVQHAIRLREWGVNAVYTMLSAQTAPQTNAPLFGAELSMADGQRGTALLQQYAIVGVQQQLDRFKTLGVQGVTIDIPYPLFMPWYANSAQYLSYYTSVAQETANRGMRLTVELGLRFPGSGITSFTYPAYCSFERDYQQMAQSIIDNISPYYMTIVFEPSTMFQLTEYQQLDPANGVQGLLNLTNYMLGNAVDSNCPSNAVTLLNKRTTRIGAGQGNWDSPDYAKGYAQMAHLDTIDIHVYPVISSTMHPFMNNILTVASYARQSGKRLSMTEAWSNKEQESELGLNALVSPMLTFSRNVFSFWQPTDQAFLTSMVHFASTNPVDYMSPFWTLYFEGYVDYTPGVYDQNSSVTKLMTTEENIQVSNMTANGPYTALGTSYQKIIATSVASSGFVGLPTATATMTATPLPTRTPWPTVTPWPTRTPLPTRTPWGR